MVGPLFLRDKMHLGTLCFWLILRVFETIDGHCGYEFSWSPYRLLPFSGSAEYHHFHHSHNVGNYSSFFYYWDSLCGTNKPYFKFKEIKKRVFLSTIPRNYNWKPLEVNSRLNHNEKIKLNHFTIIRINFIYSYKINVTSVRTYFLSTLWIVQK